MRSRLYEYYYCQVVLSMPTYSVHQTIVSLCASMKRMFVGGECMYNRVYVYTLAYPNNVSIIKLTLNLCMHASTLYVHSVAMYTDT